MNNNDLYTIIRAVEDHGHQLLDDNLPGTQLVKADAVGIHHWMGRTSIVALFEDKTQYMLNSIYLDVTGRPHISTEHVGGRIMPTGYLEDAVTEYNNADSHAKHGRIDHIVRASTKIET